MYYHSQYFKAHGNVFPLETAIESDNLHHGLVMPCDSIDLNA